MVSYLKRLSQNYLAVINGTKNKNKRTCKRCFSGDQSRSTVQINVTCSIMGRNLSFLLSCLVFGRTCFNSFKKLKNRKDELNECLRRRLERIWTKPKIICRVKLRLFSPPPPPLPLLPGKSLLSGCFSIERVFSL